MIIMTKYNFRLTGVTFGDRQANIKTLKPGDKLILEHEKDNDYDKFAVIVKTTDGKELGYIPSDYNAGIIYRFDRGIKLEAVVDQITGGQDYNHGLNIVILERK